MKRTGILTFHNTLNYGAHLQAYALCSFLNNIGLKCEIIDYQCEEITKAYGMHFGNYTNSLKTMLWYILVSPDLKRRKRAFDCFLRPYLSDTIFKSQNKENLNSIYDQIIVGSDQVWNCDLIKSDTTYFLDFSKDQICLSYAASIGKHELNDSEKKIYQKYLPKFKKISVREDLAVELLKNIGINNVSQMIDPTFLLPKKSWIQLAQHSTKYKLRDKYVLVYAQGRPVYGLSFAKRIATKNNLKVIVIHSYAKKYSGVKNIRDASIEDFLYLLLHATCVVTTSFHGMTLSLILEKDLYYEERTSENNANSRLQSLAKLFGIENRKITNNNMKIVKKRIDYNEVSRIVDIEKKKAENFLLGEIS